jgi:DNA invertase Pin-like site-specific DNA recombinase
MTQSPNHTEMRVAIYTRVSTKDKDQTTENQVQPLEVFCAAHGWPIVARYTDRVSGKSSDRSGFQQLFADARQRKFDLVLFWSLDRFSREGVLETLRYLERLTAAGVGWKSFTEQYLDSCGIFKDAVLAILAVIAKQERIRMSERVSAGMQRAKASGAKMGRKRKVFDRQVVLDLHAAGESFSTIGARVGISKALAHRVVSGARRSC